MGDRVASCNCPCGCNAPMNAEKMPTDPFDNKPPDFELCDPDFIAKKINKMQWQIKKLYSEQLEKDNEIRSLRKLLRSYGEDVEEYLQPDPLITHYRNENIKLQIKTDELQDKVKDLEETLVEYEENDECCEGLQYIRDRMKNLRANFEKQKKELREKIEQLNLRLVDAEENSSCAAITRLKEKLQQLTGNNQTVDLKGPKGDAGNMRDGDTSINDKIDAGMFDTCEEALEELKRKLEYKDKIIKDLESSLNDYAKNDQNGEEKQKNEKKRLAELENENAKLKEQLLNCITVTNKPAVEQELEVKDIENPEEKQELETKDIEHVEEELEIKDIENIEEEQILKVKDIQSPIIENYTVSQQEADQLEKAKLMDELSKMKEQSMLEQKETKNNFKKVNEDLKNTLESLNEMKKLNEEMALEKTKHLKELDKLNDELAEKLKKLEDMEKLNGDLTTENEKYVIELKALNDKLNEKMKQINDLTKLQEQLSAFNEKLSSDLGDMKKRNNQLSSENKQYQEELDKIKNELNSKIKELADLEKIQEELNEKIKIFESVNNNLKNENKQLKDNLTEKEALMQKLLEELEDLKNKLQLSENRIFKLESDLNNEKASKANLQNEIERLKNEKEKLEAEQNILKQMNDDLIKSKEQLEAKLATSENNIIKFKDDLIKLEAETKDLKQQNEALKVDREKETNLCQDLEECQKLNEELWAKLNTLQKEKDQVDAKIIELETNKKLLTGELDQVKNKLSAIEDDKRRLSFELDRKSSTLKEIENKELETKLRKHSLKSQDYFKIPDEKLINDLEQLKQKLSEMENENYRLKKQCEESKVPTDDFIDNSSSSEDYEKQISILCNELKITKGKLEKSNCERIKCLQNLDKLKLKYQDELCYRNMDVEDDYMRAIDVIKKIIKEQLEAIDRIRTFFCYLKCEISVEPIMAIMKSQVNVDGWSQFNIQEVLKAFNCLSEYIFCTEVEVQELAYLRMSSKGFDFKCWLKTLTVSELAELHDKICSTTTSIITNTSHIEDGKTQSCGDHRQHLNKNIVSFQKDLARKEAETFSKIEEIKKILQQEQNHLAKLSKQIESQDVRRSEINEPIF